MPQFQPVQYCNGYNILPNGAVQIYGADPTTTWCRLNVGDHLDLEHPATHVRTDYTIAAVLDGSASSGTNSDYYSSTEFPHHTVRFTSGDVFTCEGISRALRSKSGSHFRNQYDMTNRID